ncbi:hypothetical protein SISNIDRAFT_97151 [Sistotremastrum niveocremeum HHB9708]|uniref:F-box domain-containing protein n=2 Tax=Sistotremastraceae TaxID=3402574 RepID=A0A164U971_9AGAM|nr:hypothetical protein SISNIDRAFT_97151 [Sistotremastrum niveocremeum HHB9708]KZT44302.1 hypothetical protein SISSUDRAFT_1056668 [Sistotremastrum suecicum HHB10207 ss-3]
MLLAVPYDVLHHIIVLLAVDPVLGPPANLVPLLSVNRFLHDTIHNNHNLFRDIFSIKFDHAAPARRLPASAMHASNVARELKERCLLMRRLRSRDLAHPNVQLDLWKSLVMLLENDGANYSQLVHYAQLPLLLAEWRTSRLNQGKDTNGGYPLENPANSLVLWLTWLTQSRDDVKHEVANKTDSIMPLLLSPFLFAPFKYANAFIPDAHYELPLRPTQPSFSLPFSFRSTHGLYPVYRPQVIYPDGLTTARHIPDPPTIIHFGCKLYLTPPILAHAAQLLSFVRWEFRGARPSSEAPPTRAYRDANGLHGATVEDFDHFNTISRTPFNPIVSLTTGIDESASKRFDVDWQRLNECGNLFDEPATKHFAHVPGSLSGQWAGRLLVPGNTETHFELIGRPDIPAGFNAIFFTGFVNIRIREWHCPTTEDPLGCGDVDALDGLSNAWLPRSIRTSTGHDEQGDFLRIYDVSEATTHKYYERLPNRPIHHDPDVCPLCQDPSEGESTAEDRESPPGYSIPDMACPGFTDVIVTGETDPDHAQAWGGFKFIGRVRLYDGLIVLLREWAIDEPNVHGRWLFRGYLNGGQNWVGRWREGGTDLKVPGMEGPFTLNKYDEL